MVYCASVMACVESVAALRMTMWLCGDPGICWCKSRPGRNAAGTAGRSLLFDVQSARFFCCSFIRTFTGYPFTIELSIKKHRTLSGQYIRSPVVVHPGQRARWLMVLWAVAFPRTPFLVITSGSVAEIARLTCQTIYPPTSSVMNNAL